MDSRTCTCGKSKLQVAGFADVDLTCIFVSQFQSQRNGVTHVGYIISAKDDIVSMTAPALGVSWKFNGKDFCICGFYCIVNSCDLTGSACSGTEKPQTVVLGTYVHLFKQRIINSGDHESDCVKDCGPYKFSPCAVGADVMNIVYIHVEKSPFLLKTHWFQYSIREGNLKVKIDNIICKWQVYIVVNGIVKCKLKK